MIASCSKEDSNGHRGPVYVSCSLATPARALCAVHSNVVYADSPNEAPLIGASFVVPILPMRQSWDNASAKLRMAVLPSSEKHDFPDLFLTIPDSFLQGGFLTLS
jgi:hypothetical protein